MTRAGRRAALVLGLCAVLGVLAWLMRTDPEGSEPASAPGPAAPQLLVGRAEAHPAALPVARQGAQPVALESGSSRAAPGDSVRIAGRVLRRGDDAPLDGVEIEVIAEDAQLGEPAIVATIGSQKGAFEVPAEAVARQPHTLQFRWSSGRRWTPGNRPVTDPVMIGDSGRSQVATVRLAEATEPLDALDVWIDTGWLVRGRVVDNEGHPVEYVRVVAAANRRELFAFGPRTDADGRFLLGDLDPAQPLVLSLDYSSEPVEGSRREIAPASGGEVKDLGDLALPFRVPGARR